ncbi:glycosyl hydrolase family 95 catalytic domain-containing protein [Actinospica sp.]|uniref:glycosyl hydrolase family 95 catalytic domain-containing protein n=1 Tax=Actinospica sp. TaxID=1872142 RepID=UPI002BBFA1F7|nr:glycoside hydrolase N-terminal domain-containing protein [Actinospica sp.]HWG24416.1 glycoside hydrolase N-terminal domain-containing protein [Actinospica sp.]
MNDSAIFAQHPATDLVLSWPGAARHWVEAAPVGNGRLGAMVFGGARRAHWQINDATVWSGTPDGPGDALAELLAAGAGPDRLEEIRAAIRAEDYRLAEQLMLTFEGRYTQEYLAFADLHVSLLGDEPTSLGRALNLDNGVVAERLEVDGRTVRRTTWASRPAGVLCIALEVEDGVVDLDVELTSPLRVERRTATAVGVEIPVDGAPQHEPGVAESLRYADGPTGDYDPYGAVAMSIDTDGTLTADDATCAVRGASRVLITVASSTSNADYWFGNEPIGRDAHVSRAVGIAEAAMAIGERRLFAEHDADLRGVLGGTAVTIGTRHGGTFDVADDVLSGKDELLTATVITQLGRYLLASASRPGGGPPANLQGIWNDSLRPPWSSNYTININLQMNYWGAWQAGLGSCDEPLIELIEHLAANGTHVARELYAARGWVAHHNTDMWGWALPVGMGHGDTAWAIWMMGGVWLCQHVWEHYDFTQDTDFLRERGWPLLRGAAEFCLDWLVEGEDGLLDTIPSTSPENKFVSRHGTEESLSLSTGMDMALICAQFTRTLAAADILDIDDETCAEIRRALPRLRPPRATSDGRLREWSVDHRDAYPQHRHMSHLVAVHPLDQIDPLSTPGLAAAAMGTLDGRGPGAMGWSWSWKIALRARLGQARQAHSLLLEATRPYDGDPTVDAPPDGSKWGGLLPNLFSTHPPFQIDGNYGLMAGVLEMLVQSHGGSLRILPALPEEWADGSCRGIGCRGGLAVDVVWLGGALSELTVRRISGDPERPVSVRYGGQLRPIHVAQGSSVRLGPTLEDI